MPVVRFPLNVQFGFLVAPEYEELSDEELGYGSYAQLWVFVGDLLHYEFDVACHPWTWIEAKLIVRSGARRPPLYILLSGFTVSPREYEDIFRELPFNTPIYVARGEVEILLSEKHGIHARVTRYARIHTPDTWTLAHIRRLTHHALLAERIYEKYLEYDAPAIARTLSELPQSELDRLYELGLRPFLEFAGSYEELARILVYYLPQALIRALSDVI